MDAKKIMKHALLIFVWVSIGFAAGKHTALRSFQGEQAPPAGAMAQAPSDAPDADAPEYRVVVHYLHGNIRCVTCNSIEAMTLKTMEEEFADALADGTLVWSVENFQRNPEVGRRYDVAGSSVVLAFAKKGQEEVFRILDEVWVLVNDEDQFRRFMGEAIREYLDAGAGA